MTVALMNYVQGIKSGKTSFVFLVVVRNWRFWHRPKLCRKRQFLTTVVVVVVAAAAVTCTIRISLTVVSNVYALTADELYAAC